MEFRRLQDIQDDITYRFSVGGVKARHKSPTIRRLFNFCWAQTREIVSNSNDGTYLEATGILTLPVVPAIAGEAYAELPWPTNASRIFGVRCRSTAASKWYPLKRIPWSAHHDYQWDRLLTTWGEQRGPRGYCSRALPKATETTSTTGNIMVVPVPLAGDYRLWYLESWAPQVEDDDLFAGEAVWFEYAYYCTMIKMLGPDADAKKQYPQWSVERAEARAYIEKFADKLEDGMPLEPRDARCDGDDPENGWDNL